MQPAAPVSGSVVRHADLAAGASVAGGDFRILGAAAHKPSDVLLYGSYRVVRLREGLILHSTDAAQVEDMTTEFSRAPALILSMALRGQLDVSFGDRRVTLGPNSNSNNPEPEATLISIARTDRLVRHCARGAYVRKVHVNLEPAWLDTEGVVPDRQVAAFARDHLAIRRWRPTARMAQLAEQVLAPPAYLPALQNLYLESRAVEMAMEAMLALSSADVVDAPVLPRRLRQRIDEVRDFLDTALDDELALDAVARAAGMSVSKLQRLFRAAQGMTVFDYVRGRRLDRARAMLERDGVSVATAGYAAGYASPANFSTAFKRRFGFSPKRIRS